MHIKEIYREIYRRFDNLTPLPVDCGSLCGKLCCQSSEDEENGMYLFPGEEALFRGAEGFRLLESELTYADGKRVKLLCCTKPCLRETRPLSCRIFPLVPYYRRGSTVRIITDPRASACPLTHPIAKPYINKKFRLETAKAFRLLSQFTEIADFLEALTDVLDDTISLKGNFYDYE